MKHSNFVVAPDAESHWTAWLYNPEYAGSLITGEGATIEEAVKEVLDAFDAEDDKDDDKKSE